MRALSWRELISFWKRVQVGERWECWPWTGTENGHGYGRIAIDGTMHQAHRVAYRIAHGEIERGLFVRHKCDNRLCCNPDHLELGTVQDNTEDAMKRGRIPHSMGSGRTKLTLADVMTIRQNPDRLTGDQLAERFGVASSTISYIRNGRSWKYAPLAPRE